MQSLLDNLILNAPELGTALGYVVVCSLLMLGGMGLPIPEDIPLILAGVFCHLGLARLPTMLVVTFAFVIGADILLFFMGKRYGHHVPRLPFVRHVLTKQRLDRAEQYFEDHGGKTLFVARFLPGLRAAVWFSAGACRTKLWRLIVCDGIAALLSVPLLVLVGYFGANQLQQAQQWTLWGQLSAALIALTAAGGFVLYKTWRRKKNTDDAGSITHTMQRKAS